MTKEFYSNGKLLITGEYAVLDGALAFAIPTKFGQSLLVSYNESEIISWQSFDYKSHLWFKADFDLVLLREIETTDTKIAQTLLELLGAARELNPDFLYESRGYSVITNLTFPNDWGLGSSSTLMNNVAQWAQVDAHQLLWKTMGGSGYDISSAQYDFPILYQVKNKLPLVEEAHFEPSFKDQLYFVHLNQKQDSREAISNYRKQTFDKEVLIKKISDISKRIFQTRNISDFERLMDEHEELLSKTLKIERIQNRLFSDYFGRVKSLGGWGGDFILATGNKKTPEYFISKGFETVIPYSDMALSKK